jgi:hypothetical protein
MHLTKVLRPTFIYVTHMHYQRQILRDRRPVTTACPAFWAVWKYEQKYKSRVQREKKYFALGLLEQPG